MTWEHHLYGNDDHKGLIPKLSQRANMIRKLSFLMPWKKLQTISEGIFFSLLNYCIEVYGNVWGLSTHDDQPRNSTAFTKEDNMKLQIIVNKVLRSLTGLDHYTPVTKLCDASGKLSVHQRTALYTISSVHKALQLHKPVYSYSWFKPDTQESKLRNQNRNRVDYNLSISRGSYFYRGSRLYGQLPESLVQTSNLMAFKKGAKEWIKKNIPVLPP